MTKWLRILTVLFIAMAIRINAEPLSPDGLMTDLLSDTETVWRDGFPTNLPIDRLPTDNPAYQAGLIRSSRPTFSWIVRDLGRNVLQISYQIQVFSQNYLLEIQEELENGQGDEIQADIWDSGEVLSDASTSIPLGDDSPSLSPDSVYGWRVRTKNGSEFFSPWSAIKRFRTAPEIFPFGISRYPITLSIDRPVVTESKGDHLLFLDFGKASFGRVMVTLTGKGGETAIIRLGERVREGRVDQNPSGSTRFAEYRLTLRPGKETYRIETRQDKRNTSGAAVLVPDYIGEVMPFRYAEIEIPNGGAINAEMVRLSAHLPFEESASSFHSSNEELNAVWDLCTYSIKATTFAGIYVDGDRERIPYEGDALLNQLSHYSIDREYSTARYTQEYLITHPTWPTEWILQSVRMAWNDYLYTGDPRYIATYYDDLKAKSLIALAEPNGLISTRKGKMTREVLDSIHFSGNEIRDIVDWPHKGLAGNENAETGETDGFVFDDFNVVVNAYYLAALQAMSRFAETLGKEEDAEFFRSEYGKGIESFQSLFFDPARGVYKDGDSTDHASLHGNMFPLAFGLVPEENRKEVTAFVRSRGMACSVYGAQFLLEAVYDGEDGDYGLERMIDKSLRGWLNMIRVGSTISLEAWDDCYKPNQDWNHAWGAAPANIIPRKLLGVEPIEPGSSRIRIKPQIGNLTEADGIVPTIRGPVGVTVHNPPDGSYRLSVSIPANVTAELSIPALSESEPILLPVADRENRTSTPLPSPVRDTFPDLRRCGGFWVIPSIGSGEWDFEVKSN